MRFIRKCRIALLVASIAISIWGCALRGVNRTESVVTQAEEGAAAPVAVVETKTVRENLSTVESASPNSRNVFSFGEKNKTSGAAAEIGVSNELKAGMEAFAPWQGQNFDPTNIIRISGNVKSVKTNQQGMMFSVAVILDTKAKGEIMVDMGPLFYLRTKGMILAAGNNIEVVGSLLVKDGEERIVAVEVTKGRRSLKFRDLSGTPLWANVQPRVWSPENQGLPGWSETFRRGIRSNDPNGNGRDPNKPFVPNFADPAAASGNSEGSVLGPPSWGDIRKRQEEIRSRRNGEDAGPPAESQVNN